MVTPVVDIDVGTVYEIGERLEEAIKRTVNSTGWQSSGVLRKSDSFCQLIEEQPLESTALDKAKCSSHLHATRSCTVPRVQVLSLPIFG